MLGVKKEKVDSSEKITEMVVGKKEKMDNSEKAMEIDDDGKDNLDNNKMMQIVKFKEEKVDNDNSLEKEPWKLAHYMKQLPLGSSIRRIIVKILRRIEPTALISCTENLDDIANADVEFDNLRPETRNRLENVIMNKYFFEEHEAKKEGKLKKEFAKETSSDNTNKKGASSIVKVFLPRHFNVHKIYEIFDLCSFSRKKKTGKVRTRHSIDKIQVKGESTGCRRHALIQYKTKVMANKAKENNWKGRTGIDFFIDQSYKHQQNELFVKHNNEYNHDYRALHDYTSFSSMKSSKSDGGGPQWVSFYADKKVCTNYAKRGVCRRSLGSTSTCTAGRGTVLHHICGICGASTHPQKDHK